MLKSANLLVALTVVCSSLLAANEPRYFKADHFTSATYVALAPNGSYTVTVREHMFVRAVESGRWTKTGTRIVFRPKESGASPYGVQEVSYKGRVFLAQESDEGPSIEVPVAEIKRSLDKNSKQLPPYVFFEIDKTVYEQETKQTYPFRTVTPRAKPPR